NWNNVYVLSVLAIERRRSWRSSHSRVDADGRGTRHADGDAHLGGSTARRQALEHPGGGGPPGGEPKHGPSPLARFGLQPHPAGGLEAPEGAALRGESGPVSGSAAVADATGPSGTAHA